MPKNYKIISLDFQEKTVKFNPLQAWRDALQADLETKNYTTFVLPEMYFPDAPVDESIDLYTLNNKLAVLEPTKRLVMFRNMHFSIVFHQQTEDRLLLETNTLASGIDAVLLANKFQEEKEIIEKHANILLKMFLLEGNEDE
ncbi:hypothetical protein HRE39_10415 [Enterococcus faecalis]|nr:hypothetical protein [Enterococcus faecalis]